MEGWPGKKPWREILSVLVFKKNLLETEPTKNKLWILLSIKEILRCDYEELL